MNLSASLIQMTLSMVVGLLPHDVAVNQHGISDFTKDSLVTSSVTNSVKDNSFAASKKKIVCKAGTTLAKTPISLVAGDKLACVSTATVATAKKLLTKPAGTNACYVCHATTGIYPVTNMISNLRTQGYTLAPASITSAFNFHYSQMLGAKPITASQAKAISAYLQTLK